MDWTTAHPGQTVPDRTLGDWTCDCNQDVSGYKSRCPACGTHVTGRGCER